MLCRPRPAPAARGHSGAGPQADRIRRPAKARPGTMMRSRALSAVAAAALLAALSALAGALPAQAATASVATPNGAPVTVNNGPGDQTDPHVSGDWVTYTDNSTGGYQVHYYNLATGQDATVPSNGGQDLLSGISGTTIVFTHQAAAGAGLGIFTYDTCGCSLP